MRFYALTTDECGLKNKIYIKRSQSTLAVSRFPHMHSGAAFSTPVFYATPVQDNKHKFFSSEYSDPSVQ